MPLMGFRPLLQTLGAFPQAPTVDVPTPPQLPTLPTAGTLPPPQPAVQSAQQPQAGGGRLEQILSLIAPMLTAGLALSGNRAAAGGAAHGLLQSQIRQREFEQQQQQLRMREQQMAAEAEARAEAARVRAEAAERQRASAVLSAVGDVRAKTFRTKDEYDQYVGFVEGLLAPLGVRPHTIRSAVPFRAKTFGAEMTKALDDYFGSDLNKAAIEAGDPKLFQGAIQIDTDGDGIADKPVPILQAIKEAGYNKVAIDPQTGGPLLRPKAKPTSVQLDDERFLGAVERFTVEKGRPPTQAERGTIAEDIERTRAEQLAASRRAGAPPIGATVVIQTVDEQGRPVTRIVPKVAGSEFVSQPSVGQVGEAVATEATLARITAIRESFEEFGKTLVGPVAGRMLRGQLSLPEGAGGVDERTAQFAAAVDALKNEVIKQITGAALSEAEAQRIMRALPDLTQPPKVFSARLAETERNLQTMQAARNKRLGVGQHGGTEPAGGVEVWIRGPDGKLRKKGIR